jgi:hypothetical protein
MWGLHQTLLSKEIYFPHKAYTTYKCLVGITPYGAISYVSDIFERSISDREIVIKSGFIEKLEPGDMILADRGFTIKDILLEKQVTLNIPPFLRGRSKLSAHEELQTRRIARVRIHVERAIGRIKKFILLGKKLPLSLASVTNQLVFVACCLVNFQQPLVS